jgi:predicted RNA polymerase sigma factor
VEQRAVNGAPRHRGDVEDLLRQAAPRVLAAVVRRFGDFADSEDAVQEAMIDAARQWPVQGAPESPTGWLIAVASRRMTDGPGAGLELLAEVEPRLEGHHRIHAVRAHLLELAGDGAGAHAEYVRAAELTASVPEQRYLTKRATRLAGAA